MQKLSNVTYKSLAIEKLNPGYYQPRQNFAQEALHELAESIKTYGILEPLLVRESLQGYEILAGERRWRAAQIVGLAEVPCLIGEYGDETAAAITLIENIQRQDLNLMEEATGYQRLHHEFHLQQDEIAALTGKSRSHIANILRLLNLSEPVQEALRHGKLALGHARMLVGLTAWQQSELLQQILTLDWSVRRLEEAVRNLKKSPISPATSNSDTLRLQAQLADQMGAPVILEGDNHQGGWLKIKYFDHDTLTGLLARLGLSYD